MAHFELSAFLSAAIGLLGLLSVCLLIFGRLGVGSIVAFLVAGIVVEAVRDIPAHSYPDSFDLSHPEIDFTALAGSLGVSGLRVDKPAQVEDAVGRMLAHQGPFLIDLDTT